VLLDCVIYCAFYSILFRGAVFFRSLCSLQVLHITTKSSGSEFQTVGLVDCIVDADDQELQSQANSSRQDILDRVAEDNEYLRFIDSGLITISVADVGRTNIEVVHSSVYNSHNENNSSVTKQTLMLTSDGVQNFSIFRCQRCHGQ